MLYGSMIIYPIKARKCRMDIDRIKAGEQEMYLTIRLSLFLLSEGRRWRTLAVFRREEDQGEEQEHHDQRDEEQKRRWRG